MFHRFGNIVARSACAFPSAGILHSIGRGDDPNRRAVEPQDGCETDRAALSGRIGIGEDHNVSASCNPWNDPQATAVAIATLLSDEPRRQRMAAAALRRVASEFTWERKVREYDAHLRILLNGDEKFVSSQVRWQK